MIHNQFYGDNTRWFIGTVINIQDPLQLGRIRVRIFGVHSEYLADIEEGDLPWAQVVVPITEGGTSGIGTNLGIKPATQVYGIFLDGKNSQLPLVLGSIPKYERGIAAKVYEPTIPKEVQHDSLIDARSSVKNLATASQIDKENLVGATNLEKAFNFFISEEGGNFSPAQASGIIGNLWVESGANSNKGDLNPIAQSSPPERSFGIAQWNSASAAGNRYGSLLDFAAKRNMPWYSLYCQLLFIKKELNDKTYFGLSQLKKTKDPTTACKVFADKYERPAYDAVLSSTGSIVSYKYDETGVRRKRHGEDERISISEEVFRKFA